MKNVAIAIGCLERASDVLAHVQTLTSLEVIYDARYTRRDCMEIIHALINDTAAKRIRAFNGDNVTSWFGNYIEWMVLSAIADDNLFSMFGPDLTRAQNAGMCFFYNKVKRDRLYSVYWHGGKEAVLDIFNHSSTVKLYGALEILNQIWPRYVRSDIAVPVKDTRHHLTYIDTDNSIYNERIGKYIDDSISAIEDIIPLRALVAELERTIGEYPHAVWTVEKRKHGLCIVRYSHEYHKPIKEIKLCSRTGRLISYQSLN